MGWNKLELTNPSPLLSKAAGEFVYFVHSYHAVPKDKSIITSVCDYGTKITASVGRGSVQAVQFHPEKSSSVGIEILQAFKEWKP
jgi:glutamine amidotransferase